MSEIKIEFVQLEQQLEMLTIMLDRPLYKGDELAITIKYYGNIITKGSVGVFLASYLETNKETNEGMRKFLVSTMFQPHFARRMVPCFDEPQFKAIWKVEVIHPSLLNAISNGKILQIEALSNGWTKTSFDVTPIMSSYLLAVAITEFEFEDVQTKNCTLRFWAQDTNNSRFKRFKSISKTVFDYLSDYFGMNFSLEVLNSVIIPTELKFTGMENWGLISYQNKTILLDDSIPLNFRSMVHIITHELVHQWIGNIVTYETFKQLWLNEGIAEFITDITTEILFPEAQLNKHFFLRWQRIAIGVDYNNYKYPLENDHDDLRSYPKHLYLAYKKGYGIEKMIYHILGPEVFKSSIREYLKAFKFSNVNSDKYFSILQLNADRNNITVNFDLFKNEWVLMDVQLYTPDELTTKLLL
uniref:Peptidase_M1 domain-containing protein n=1 Tax=Rhabditophanes sp. KR3021 TaxID=114890 RepID=A0AC35U799_9BILA